MSNLRRSVRIKSKSSSADCLEPSPKELMDRLNQHGHGITSNWLSKVLCTLDVKDDKRNQLLSVLHKIANVKRKKYVFTLNDNDQ